MPNPLLPRLTVTNQVTAFGNAGRWEKRDSVELERISEGLDVTPPKVASAEVDSIPSMWARPLLFEMALYDTRHPMHERVLGEWRGLLAMLALKEWCDFPLTTERIEITDTKNPPDAEEFLRALQKLLPKDTLDATTTWDTLNLILFDDKPIGITSPTTLVCTSVSCFGRISGVPWLNKKFLDNPVSKLNSFEKEAVAGWLKHLYGYTQDLPDSKIKANLREHLHSFIEDLGKAPAVSSLSKTGLGLTQDLFKCMNNPVAPRDLPSSVELVPSSNKQPQTILLVPDQGIPEVWGVEPQNVFVWKSKTLATTQSFSGQSKLTLPTHVHLRSQKDFFTDKLFVINQEKAFQEHSTLVAEGSEDLNFNRIPVTPILPITEELLTYLDVRDLNKRITFDQQRNVISVSLRLPLSGINGQKRDFHIFKEYSAQNVVAFDYLPVLEIWPNFKTPDWKAYYTYFSKVSQNTFYATPFLEDNAPPLSLESAGDDENEITKTSYFPEAMLCQYKAPNSSSYEDAGVLLILVPDSPITDGSTWTVGIDFGTTSTAVYRNDERTAPCPIKLGKRLIQVTDSDATDRLSLYENFLSLKSEQTPFFSLFHISKNHQNDPNQLRPLFDGHIYFLSDYQKFNEENTKGRIFSDLKWSIETVNRERTQLFLEQLCLQCAAEAVTTGAKGIKWRFSFPMAFSDIDEKDFKERCKKVTNSCSKVTGLANAGVEFEPESIVIAKYFANPDFPGTFASGAVCIDIGGATSDISIWRNNRLYSQTSLRFAGRDIFLNLLTENPTFLQRLGVEKKITAILEGTSGETKRYAQTDTLLERDAESWLEHFSHIKREFPANEFHQLIAIGIAGLLYYVGLLLKYLTENKTIQI